MVMLLGSTTVPESASNNHLVRTLSASLRVSKRADAPPALAGAWVGGHLDAHQVRGRAVLACARLNIASCHQMSSLRSEP